jgi:hypothetical protein
MIHEHAPDLPNNTRSSICDALSTYVQSQMKDCSNKLLACATSLYQYCAMVNSGQTRRQEKVEGSFQRRPNRFLSFFSNCHLLYLGELLITMSFSKIYLQK